MKKLFSYDFRVRNETLPEGAEKLSKLLAAATPWLDKFETWVDPQPLFSGVFGATIWGSDEPWNGPEGFARIAEASHCRHLQDQALEFLFPMAMAALIKSAYAERVAGGTVIFPAWSGAWHGRPSGARFIPHPRASDHERANDWMYRTAKTFGLSFPWDGSAPSLSAGYLFPITDRGEDVPHKASTRYLQIHR